MPFSGSLVNQGELWANLTRNRGFLLPRSCLSLLSLQAVYIGAAAVVAPSLVAVG